MGSNSHADRHRAIRAGKLVDALDALTTAAGYEPHRVASGVRCFLRNSLTQARRETLSRLAGIRGVASDDTLGKVLDELLKRTQATPQLPVSLHNLLGDLPQVTHRVCAVCGGSVCRKESCADEAGIRGIERFRAA